MPPNTSSNDPDLARIVTNLSESAQFLEESELRKYDAAQNSVVEARQQAQFDNQSICVI